MTEGWPPRWTAPQFKEKRSAKVGRGLRREKRASKEKDKKGEVRKRDKYCRFPLCGCKRFGLALHVSHLIHKGPGGNPKGDRSEPEIMVYVCSARHRENIFAIDQKTIRWRALTPKGANGPIAWDIKIADLKKHGAADALRLALGGISGQWLEIARETGIHLYEPSTPEQVVILAWLRGMEH